MAEKVDPREIRENFANYAMLLANLAEHAAEIANTRRRLFEAYLSEGFNEAQAIDLCKVIM